MGNRRVLALLGALALAGLGTLVLVLFVTNAEDRALEGEEVVNVLVVSEAIPAGTPAGDIAGLVELEKVPAKVVNEGAVGDLGELSGLVSSIDLLPGDQLTQARFVTPDAFSPSRSQIDVPTGLLEITVTLDPTRTIGGTIRPGDTVALISSFSETFTPGVAQTEPLPPAASKTSIILRKVLVTNVQGAPLVAAAPAADGTVGDRAAAPEGSLLITLAVDAGAAERIAFTAEFGTMYLAREPADAPEGGTQIQTIDSIFG